MRHTETITGSNLKWLSVDCRKGIIRGCYILLTDCVTGRLNVVFNMYCLFIIILIDHTNRRESMDIVLKPNVTLTCNPKVLHTLKYDISEKFTLNQF